MNCTYTFNTAQGVKTIKGREAMIEFLGQYGVGAIVPRNAPANGIHVGIARAALAQAYGDLPDQLERKGLLAVSQTLDDAINRAAQMRANAMGQSFEQARSELMDTVQNSSAMRLWIGSRTVNDAIIPETPEYANSKTGDLAYVPQNAKVPAGPIRVAVGIARAAHQGFGIEHMADNARRDVRRVPPAATDDLAENLMRQTVNVLGDVSTIHRDGSAYVFASQRKSQAIVAKWTGENYSVITVRPFNGDAIRLWGVPEWRGRLAFPFRAVAEAAPSTASHQVNSPQLGRDGQEVYSEKFNLTNGTTNPQAATPTVTVKKRRILDIKRSTNGDVQAFFDPQTGTAHMVAEHLSADSAPGVMMHEVGIHMAADGSMQPIFNRAKMLLRAQKADPFIQRVQARLDAAGESSGEEAAAYMVEEYERDRLSAPASVRRWLENALATVKAWLNRKGILGADKLTVADIAAVARANAKSMARGDVGGGVKFSRTGGTGQTMTEAFKRWFGDSKVVDADGKPLVSRSSLVAARKSAMLEGRMNGGSSNAKSIADLLVSQAFSLKGLGGLEIPAQRKVLNGVLSLGDDFKVLRSVVDLVPVDVVNILAGKNLSPEMLFRDEAMLKQLLSADRDGSVSTAIDIADALVVAVAGVAAKGSAIASNPFAGTQKVGSAADTGDADVLHDAILNQTTGNNGDFDGANPDIRFSRTPQWQEPKEQPQAEQPPTWAAPKDTRWDYLTYNMQDRQIDTKRVQQSIEANNGPLPDELNVRQREELFYGRDAKEVQDFKTQELNPMLEQLGKDGIELPEFEEYLHARHAPEANRVMAERNPNQDMINAGRATAAQEITALAVKIKATTNKDELRILNKAMGNAMADLSRWRKVKPYGGSEESRLALSGMSNQQAQEIMDGLMPEELAGMERSAAMFDAIVAKNRALMVEYGLESRDTVDGWAGLFQHYVPLMREEAEGAGLHNGLGTGQGFSIKGREVKSRTGSAEKKVVDIVANLAMQRERTITRGEKNRVAATMIELARANPNPDFWKVGAPDRKRVYDRATRTVKWVTDPTYKQRDEVVVAKFVKDNGQIEEVALTFNKADPRAMRMATAFKNLDDASLNKVLRTMAPVTRTLAALSTQYNPMWGIFNFTRDTFGLMISLGNTPLTSKNGNSESVRLRIYKDAWKALPALWRGAHMERKGKEDTSAWGRLWEYFQSKEDTSEWGRLWEDFQKVGGATGFRDMIRTSNERTDQLKTVVDPDAWMETTWGKVVTAGGTIKPLAGQAKRGFEALSNLISDFNLGLENAARVATYKAALDQGLSQEQAASIAKNITVNFNRRGAVGHQIGAGWAFFNASVQGSARMADALTVMGRPGDPRSIRLSDFGKAVVYGGLAIGALQALALAAAGFEDDEPPEFVRDRNLTIPTGWTGVGPDKGYITLPMPLGYNIIPAFGRRLTEFVLAGGEDPFKHATGMVGLVFDGFNPIGSGSFTQMVMPTLLDPIAAAIQNTDSFGRPIARETMDRNIPGHQMARDAATDAARLASRAINYISGGDEYTAGKWSPSPDQLDYVVGQYGGGVAREIIKLWQLASGTARGEEVPFYKVPLLGRFAGSADSASSQGNAYYSNINKIDQAEKRIKGLAEDGKRSEAQAERRKPEALLIAKAKVAEREVTRLRHEKRRLLEAGAERSKVRAVEAKITDAMRRLNEAAKAQGI